MKPPPPLPQLILYLEGCFAVTPKSAQSLLPRLTSSLCLATSGSLGEALRRGRADARKDLWAGAGAGVGDRACRESGLVPAVPEPVLSRPSAIRQELSGISTS